MFSHRVGCSALHSGALRCARERAYLPCVAAPGFRRWRACAQVAGSTACASCTSKCRVQRQRQQRQAVAPPPPPPPPQQQQQLQQQAVSQWSPRTCSDPTRRRSAWRASASAGLADLGRWSPSVDSSRGARLPFSALLNCTLTHASTLAKPPSRCRPGSPRLLRAPFQRRCAPASWRAKCGLARARRWCGLYRSRRASRRR